MSHPIEQPPAQSPRIQDCFFYHTMDLPGHGLAHGQWDLRAGLDSYLGGVDLSESKVLEIGPASGFLTFAMESCGTEVTSCELPSFDQWDLVPYAGVDLGPFIEDRLELGRRLRNAYWLAHAAHESRARLVECPVYDIPATLGPFDVALFGMVLVHVRDPFRALQSAAAITEGTIIVTEVLPGWDIPPAVQEAIREHAGQEPAAGPVNPKLAAVLERDLSWLPPSMHFCPRFAAGEPKETWWQYNPSIVREFLGVLGFRSQSVSYHYQTYDPKYRWAEPAEDSAPVQHLCFTVVASR